MIRIAFTKLHGAENDFLLTWGEEAPDANLPDIARSICARNTGIGADGWMLVWHHESGLRTRLFNSDGSEPEISGNGTRCAAAFGFLTGAVQGGQIGVVTAAGEKQLELISRKETRFEFRMNMGLPALEELHRTLRLNGADYDATVLNVGNPQCAIFVDRFPEDWRAAATEAERHPAFPKRANVSMVRVQDRHTLDVLFYERGAGETRSSGTGSMGAGAAAILRGVADSPISILTPAGPLTFIWSDSVYLTGPAEAIGEGTFYFNDSNN